MSFMDGFIVVAIVVAIIGLVTIKDVMSES